MQNHCWVCYRHLVHNHQPGPWAALLPRHSQLYISKPSNSSSRRKMVLSSVFQSKLGAFTTDHLWSLWGHQLQPATVWYMVDSKYSCASQTPKVKGCNMLPWEMLESLQSNGSVSLPGLECLAILVTLSILLHYLSSPRLDWNPMCIMIFCICTFSP